MKRKIGETSYSATIEGDDSNWHWTVRFDATDKCLGISQWEEGSKDVEPWRVFLSRRQVVELLAFFRREGMDRKL
jgi:hypothetical protein